MASLMISRTGKKGIEKTENKRDKKNEYFN